MRNRYGRLAAITRAAAVAAVAFGITTPAAAQFGGLGKKIKAASSPAASKPAAPAEAQEAQGGAGGDGGTVVLTADVLDKLVNGLKAGEAERQAAAKEDTPYGKYQRALAAYEVAKPKCEAGQQTFATRAAADEKMMDKYSALVDKMVAAQTRGDQKMAMVYNDSAMAMQDPNCVIKQPEQPGDYYEAQRSIDARSEKTAVKSSGLSPSEFAQARERAEGVLRGGAPDASASEKSAVSARAAELKPLLGFREAPPERAAKPAPAAAPAQSQAPTAPAGMSAMNACMMRNTQNHQKEIEALGKRAEAAQKAGDQSALMAIADTLQQIQMAGCTGGR